MKNRKSLLIGTAITLTLVLLISFAPALTVKYQLRKQLLQLGAEQVDIASVYLNPWSGYFELKGLSASAQDKPSLKLGLLQTELGYRELWSKRLLITQLKLDDTELHLRQHQQQWQLGPITLPAPAEESEPESEPTEWRWGLNGFEINRLNSSYSDDQMSHHFVIDSAVLKLLHQWTPQEHSELNFHGQLNNSPIRIDTRGTPLAALPKLVFDIQLEELALAPLSAPWVPGLQGSLTTHLKVELEQLENGIKLRQSGNLALADFGYQSPELTTSAASISWQGSASQQLDDGTLTSVDTDNTLIIDGLVLNQSEAGLVAAEQQLKLEGAVRLEGTEKIAFNGKFGSAKSTLTLPELDLSTEARSWNGQIDVELGSEGLSQLRTDGELKLEQLALQQPGLQLNEQQIALSGQLQTDLKALIFDGQLATQPARIAYQQLRIANQSRRWQGGLTLDLATAALNRLSGDIKLGPLQLKHRDGQPLVDFKALQLKQLATPEPNQIQIGQIQLDQLKLGDQQPLLTLDKLAINEILASETATQIASIHPGELNTRVDLDQDKQPYRWLEWVALLSGTPKPTSETKAEQQTAKQAADKADDSATYPFKLRQFALQQPAQIQVSEYSKKTKKQGKPVKLTINQFNLEQVDTTSTDTSPFKLQAQANRFGKIELAGNYALFADNPDAQWQSKISGMSLPPFSRLMRRETGYQIQSGKLALNSNGTIKQGLVDSSNHLVINNFVVEPASKGATDEFDGQLGMPLGTAVSLLTDSKDNVELDLPVKGALSDPEFGVQSVINIVMAKVAREAAMGYLAVTLQPYGALLSLGRMAANAVEGSAINLDPIQFEPGSSTLTPASQDYLAKIGGMLKERKGLRLKLCGQSVAADAQWLLAQRQPTTSQPGASASQAAASTTDKPAPPELNEQELEQLLQLAEERGFIVKNHLIGQHKADDGQLFSCLAKVSPTLDTPPQVKLGL